MPPKSAKKVTKTEVIADDVINMPRPKITAAPPDQTGFQVFTKFLNPITGATKGVNDFDLRGVDTILYPKSTVADMRTKINYELKFLGFGDWYVGEVWVVRVFGHCRDRIDLFEKKDFEKHMAQGLNGPKTYWLEVTVGHE